MKSVFNKHYVLLKRLIDLTTIKSITKRILSGLKHKPYQLKLKMSLWNTFRLLFNSAIVFAFGYCIRHLTHTKSYIPNGKQILTMAANKGNAAFQYTMKKKNRTNVVVIVLFTILVIIVCYKLQRRFSKKSSLECEDEDVNNTSSLKRSKHGDEESLDKRKKK